MAEPDHTPLPDTGVAVSVILCTFNRERYLPGALESLVRQTADPARHEIVIVNNASTDRTDAICRAFVAAHPERRITYVTERQQGLAHARNRGAAEASGRVLTYIDDDAVASPELIEKVQAFFHTHGDAAAVGGRVLAVFEGTPPGWLNRFSARLFFSHYDRGSAPFRYTRRGGYPIGCNMSLRADVLRRAHGFDTALGRRGTDAIGGEEKELFSRLLDWGLPFYYEPDQVVFHRIDTTRTDPQAARTLALGLGRSHRRMYCNGASRLACVAQVLLTGMKLVAAAGLAVLYLGRGRPEVSRHLLWYRWLVLKGMFVGR